MKKLLMAAMVISLVFCMAQVTVADDRLKVNGGLRLRAFNLDNETTYAEDVDDNQKYYDYRFRLGLAITVAEGITANLRTDLQDDEKWGFDRVGPGDSYLGRSTIVAPAAGSNAKSAGTAMVTDRAYLRVEKDMFILQAGQIFQAFGDRGAASAYAPQDHGIALRLKLPVTVDLNYFKIDEGTSVIDEDDAAKDVDGYAAQVAYSSDMFTAAAYYAMQSDGKDSKVEPNVIGLWGNVKIGPVKVRAALDMFGGSSDAADVDYMGTQLWLNGQMNFTKSIDAGLNIYYAMAQSDDGSDQQLTAMPGKFGGFEPMEYGVQTLADGLDPAGNNTPFDLEGQGAGTMGADVYGHFGIMDGAITFAAQLGYAMPQDDDITAWENTLYYEGSVSWAFAPKAELLGVAYGRSVSSEDDAFGTESPIGFAALCEVNF